MRSAGAIDLRLPLISPLCGLAQALKQIHCIIRPHWDPTKGIGPRFLPPKTCRCMEIIGVAYALHPSTGGITDDLHPESELIPQWFGDDRWRRG